MLFAQCVYELFYINWFVLGSAFAWFSNCMIRIIVKYAKV